MLREHFMILNGIFKQFMKNNLSSVKLSSITAELPTVRHDFIAFLTVTSLTALKSV
jgi:hypothetical protein